MTENKAVMKRLTSVTGCYRQFMKARRQQGNKRRMGGERVRKVIAVIVLVKYWDR